MAKKRLDKSSRKWECKHGCDIQKKPCKHIESLIADTNGTMSREFREKLEMVKITEESIQDHLEYAKNFRVLQQSLEKVGLESWRAELLMDRYVDKLSLAEIAKTRGYLRTKKVWELINDTVAKLQLLGLDKVTKALKEHS